MKVGYRLSSAATADLSDIWDYVADAGSADIADKVIGDIRSALERIGESPGIGHFREDVVGPNYKVYVVFRYSIIYKYGIKPVGIARILHSARDMRSILS